MSSASKLSNMQWTNSMVIMLYTIVQQTNAHLVPRKDSKSKWSEVTNNLFAQDEMLGYRDPYFLEENREITSGRVKDKFNVLQKAYIDQMRLGANKSGNNENGPPDYFALAAIIQQQRDDAAAARKDLKDGDAKRIEHMNSTEAEVLKKFKGGGPRKNADGTFSGVNKRKREAENLDHAIMKVLASASSSGTGDLELATKAAMMHWVKTQCKTLDHLLEDANINYGEPEHPPPSLSVLMRLGLKGIISVYCARGSGLAADKFLLQMERMGVDSLDANLLLAALEEWKETADNWEAKSTLDNEEADAHPTPHVDSVGVVSSVGSSSSLTRKIDFGCGTNVDSEDDAGDA